MPRYLAGIVSRGSDAPWRTGYIASLIGLGDRKIIQPLAARTDDVGYDQLHHSLQGDMGRRAVQKLFTE